MTHDLSSTNDPHTSSDTSREVTARDPDSPPSPDAVSGSDITLSTLHEVLVMLAGGDGVGDTLNLITEKARILTGCASAAIALLEADRENLVFAAASGHDDADLLGSRVHWSDTVAGTAARTGTPYFAFRPGTLRNGATPVASAAVVPIFVNGASVGALAALDKNTGGPFSGADLMALSTLAAAAAVAVESGALRGDTQRQRRELSSIYEAVRSVSGHLSAQEVLRAVVEQVTAHVDSSAVVILLLNDERTHLYIADDAGLDDEAREVTLPADLFMPAAVLGTSQPVFLAFGPAFADGSGAAAAAVVSEPLFPGKIGATARSGLAAAIRSGDAAHGLVLVLSGQPLGAFSAADANLVSALAAQAAVAMENAWLYEDANRRAEEAAALYELSQTVTSTLSLPSVLERVADSVVQLLAVDKFALFLQESAAERLKMVVSRGLSAEATDRIRPLIGQGIPGWVMEFETPTAVQDVAADHRNQSAPLHTEGVVSLICTPLQVGASPIGVVCGMSSRRRLFNIAEMELLYTIANQAAIAIENARVYAAVRQKSLELRKYFHRVARALGSARDPREVPLLVANLTMEVMGADRCAVYVVIPGVSGERVLDLAASVGFRVQPFSSPESKDGATFLKGTPTEWIARRSRPLAIPAIADDERFAERVERPLRGKLGSYLGVPLTSGDETVGVLEIYTRAPRTWRGDEIRLLLTFASQAAVAFRGTRVSPHFSGESLPLVGLLTTLLGTSVETRIVPAHDLSRLLATGLGTRAVILRRDGAGQWQVASDSGAGERRDDWLAHVIEAAGRGDILGRSFQITFDAGGVAAAAVDTSAPLAGDAAEGTVTTILAAAAGVAGRGFGSDVPDETF